MKVPFPQIYHNLLSYSLTLPKPLHLHSFSNLPYIPRIRYKIAIEGCCHGQLDAIYSHIATLEERNKYKVDLLLICGDFQAIRNIQDLQCMAVPNKYKELGGFWKYYTGVKKAPILTIVIGGNHEASNYMWELYHGGWLAPNIYFLGHAGCVKVNGIRITGASGIFKKFDFDKGNFERVPYTSSSMRSIYHLREFNVRRLSLLSKPTIFLSHDWPQSIEHHGNLRYLLSKKSFLRQDIERGVLGSPPMMGLLRNLKPDWWFAAHLHTRFEARVEHFDANGNGNGAVGGEGEVVGKGKGGVVVQAGGGGGEKTKNPDEIVIDDDDELDDVPKAKETEKTMEVEVEVEKKDEEVMNVVSVTPLSPKSAAAPLPPVVERTKINPDEIMLDDEEEVVEAPPPPPPQPQHHTQDQHQHQTQQQQVRRIPNGPVTQFLALDKCLPKRQFLEVVDIPTSEIPNSTPSTSTSTNTNFNTDTTSSSSSSSTTTPKLEFDPEWLAITKAFQPLFSTTYNQPSFPPESGARALVSSAREWILEKVQQNDPTKQIFVDDTQTFIQTAPGPEPGTENEQVDKNTPQPPAYSNPQTVAFCQLLKIENKINVGATSVIGGVDVAASISEVGA